MLDTARLSVAVTVIEGHRPNRVPSSGTMAVTTGKSKSEIAAAAAMLESSLMYSMLSTALTL